MWSQQAFIDLAKFPLPILSVHLTNTLHENKCWREVFPVATFLRRVAGWANGGTKVINADYGPRIVKA